MKIITESAVYVQKNDIVFLNQTDLPIPASIFMKLFGDGIVIIDDSNRFEFIKFEEKSEIEYFRKIDWIIDYALVKDLEEEQILELAMSIDQERNSLAEKWNQMSEAERSKNIHIVETFEALEFKIYSLRDILWFKQGHIKMTLPEVVCEPVTYKKPQEKGLKRLLRLLKKTN